ncbi:hypothetical protein TWF706_006941 [Orbilia oligospora]|nr:hypothetical protein TWF706_006941 [Orbilia oligospora]
MAQYRSLILRQTEHPFSSSLPLLSDDQKSSSYACANCSSPLFLPNTKFASGTGWPAFSSAIPGAIKTKTDWRLKEDGKWVVLGGSLGLKLREEVVCGRCGGHLGHVFRGEKWAKVEEEVEGKGVTRHRNRSPQQSPKWDGAPICTKVELCPILHSVLSSCALNSVKLAN